MKRYVLEAEKITFIRHFEIDSQSEILFEPSYNIMPGHLMTIIVKGDGDSFKAIQSTWGLDTGKNSDDRPASIPTEEVKESEAYQKLVKSSPCIIPASGFYKWKETVDDPHPFYIRVLSQDLMGIAGIYHSYENRDGKTVHTYAALTLEANPLIQPLDDRMPCLLTTAQYENWMNGKGLDMMKGQIKNTAFLTDMAVVRVPELVNDPTNNSKELIQPIPKLKNYEKDND